MATLFENSNKNKSTGRNTILLHGFHQLVKCPTRYDLIHHTASLIDVVLTNIPSRMANVQVIPLSIADHDAVGCIRKMNHQKFNWRFIECRDYRTYDPAQLRQDIKNSDLHKTENCSDTNQAWKFFKETLTSIFSKHAPIVKKKVRGKPCPWMTSDIKKKMKDRDALLRICRRTKKENDTSSYKRKRNEVNIAVRKAKSNYFTTLLEENKNLPDKFWGVLKKLFPKNTSAPPAKCFTVDGETVSEPAKISAGFAKFYSSVIKSVKCNLFPLNDLIWRKVRTPRNKTEKRFKFTYVSKNYRRKAVKEVETEKIVRTGQPTSRTFKRRCSRDFTRFGFTDKPLPVHRSVPNRVEDFKN